MSDSPEQMFPTDRAVGNDHKPSKNGVRVFQPADQLGREINVELVHTRDTPAISENELFTDKLHYTINDTSGHESYLNDLVTVQDALAFHVCPIRISKKDAEQHNNFQRPQKKSVFPVVIIPVTCRVFPRIQTAPSPSHPPPPMQVAVTNASSVQQKLRMRRLHHRVRERLRVRVCH